MKIHFRGGRKRTQTIINVKRLSVSNYLQLKYAPHAGRKCLIWINLTGVDRTTQILLQQMILIKHVLGYALFCFSYENIKCYIIMRTVIRKFWSRGGELSFPFPGRQTIVWLLVVAQELKQVRCMDGKARLLRTGFEAKPSSLAPYEPSWSEGSKWSL